MIVVTAPTGNIGRTVVLALLEAGQRVRVVVRDARRLSQKVREKVEVIEGSHSDSKVIRRALTGATSLFWLVPPDFKQSLSDAYLSFSEPAAKAISDFKVSQVVSITALGRGTRWAAKAGLVSASIQMDDLLMKTGAAFRGLAMPSFIDNLSQQQMSLLHDGCFYGTSDPDIKFPTTATRDIGAVAAQLLADREWTGQKEIGLLGPQDLSMQDEATIVSNILGKPVRYEQVTYADFKKQLLTRGMSESFAQGYVDMMRSKNEGMDFDAKSDEVLRMPTSFGQWCEEELQPMLTQL